MLKECEKMLISAEMLLFPTNDRTITINREKEKKLNIPKKLEKIGVRITVIT